MNDDALKTNVNVGKKHEKLFSLDHAVKTSDDFLQYLDTISTPATSESSEESASVL